MIKITYGGDKFEFEGVTQEQLATKGITFSSSFIHAGYLTPVDKSMEEVRVAIAEIQAASGTAPTPTSVNTGGVEITISMNGSSARKTITAETFAEYKGQNTWFSNTGVNITSFYQLTPGMTVSVTGKQDGNK